MSANLEARLQELRESWVTEEIRRPAPVVIAYDSPNHTRRNRVFALCLGVVAVAFLWLTGNPVVI